MLHKRSSFGTRKVSPPQPICMTNEQKASYLADLRNNRPTRPAGSRPLPGRPQASIIEDDLPPRSGSALSMRRHFESLANDEAERYPTLSKRASMPLTNTVTSVNGAKGRPLVPTPNTTMTSRHRRVSPSLDAGSEQVRYKESSARELEREEAHKLREALERIDQEGDEKRIHEAAKFEAADLVWRHKNPQLAEAEKTAAYRNPDLGKKSYGSLSQKPSSSTLNAKGSKGQLRSSSGGSNTSQGSITNRLPWLRRRRSKINSQDLNLESSEESRYIQNEGDEITALPQTKGRRTSSGGRKVSSGSSKSIFRNPEDQIYEEPEATTVLTQPPKQELPLKDRSRNSLPRGSRPLPGKPTAKVERFEIWKNPPSQSRNAGYTANQAVQDSHAWEDVEQPATPKSRTVEIRSEDIRAATSMKKKDRSPNLPTPTAVSDRAGRPIVSFDPRWQPSNESPRNSLDRERSIADATKPSIPTITIQEDSTKLSNGRHRQTKSDVPSIPSIAMSSAPPIPTILLPDDPSTTVSNSRSDVPVINLPDEEMSSKSAPSIRISDEPASRPLPQTASHKPRPLPQPGSTGGQSSMSKKAAVASRFPWLSRAPTTASAGSTVSCTACDLPISGRIVTASGSAKTAQKARFHPECFACYYCNTPLECVSFYPEPDNARLERFQSALSHLPPDDEQIQTLAQSNEDLHFFCHLDFHEHFSPRCHSCKTPVEGAVILALGRHYHPDHFFCAECGDPFSQDSPFVEHNNYAYCVSCHTKRTSARCRSCKKQILDEMTIEALGGKWHDACFVCFECGGDFGEEGRFFVREVEVELTEKEKRKGLTTKFEERAACQACEELRVKNVDVFI